MGEIASSLDHFGERYVRRVFTAGERADTADDSPPVRAGRLAARFAVKEAVMKALSPGPTVPAWTDIESRTGPWGAPRIVLHGDAAELAASGGIDRWAVSTAHEAGVAVAVVVASRTRLPSDPPPVPPDPPITRPRKDHLAVDDQIRSVLAAHGRLTADAGGVGDQADLYQLGLTSHATVNVMLALEDAFDIEFPDRLLRKKTFESVDAIRAALLELGVAAGA